MSGLLNNLGAVSGILGTTVGTGGSTSASDLDSGTLATARMAAGTVLQVQEMADAVGTSTLSLAASATSTSNIYNLTSTVQKASSKFIIMFYSGFTNGGSGDQEWSVTRIIDPDGTAASTVLPFGTGTYGGGSSRIASTWYTRSLSLEDAPAQAAGVEIKYQMYFKNGSGSDTLFVTYSSGYALMTVTEFA